MYLRYTVSRSSLPAHVTDGTPDVEVYRHMNAALRTYASDTTSDDLRAELLEAWLPLTRTLVSALEKVPTASAVVYRGVGGDWSIYGPHYRQGRVVRFSGFTSTSATATTAYVLAHEGHGAEPKDVWLFKLTTLSAKPLSGLSMYEGEREFVLPPFSTFVVTFVATCQVEAAGDTAVPFVGLAELVCESEYVV